MVRINWTIQSKSDLKQIANYISIDSIKYAKLQIIRIKNRTQVLKTHKYIGKVVLEAENENMRQLIEGRYRIIYKIVNQNQIDILTVHHTARDLSKRNLI